MPAGRTVKLPYALFFALAMATLALPVGAQPAFEDPELEAEYQSIIREVRCLVCQNQNIADSSAPLAADLRREIRRMLGEGASRSDVTDFLVARYGDFVLYRPPLQPSTWSLWIGPFVLIGVGAIVFARIVRARARQPLTEDDDA